MFVHDFVAVDLPLETLVNAFRLTCTDDVLAAIVLDAWHREAGAMQNATATQPIRTPVPTVHAEIGAPRLWSDSVIVPILWRASGDDWIPSVDADLELAPFGPHRSHLHLLGRYELPPGITRWSPEASLLNRLSVAVVRRTLDRISQHLARPTTHHDDDDE